MTKRAPALFISHGAPMIALEQDGFTSAMRAWGEENLRDARAIVIVSAHWQSRGAVHVGAAPRPELIYDFGGFDPELYRLRYDAPGDPLVARRVVELLTGAGIDAAADTARGWDHGVWIPLRIVRPEADVPVVEVSLPYPAEPSLPVAVGEALRPLRDEGIVLAGSGGVVHNLRMLDFANRNAEPAPWALAFDSWVADRIAAHDIEGLTRYHTDGPYASSAVPTPEHFEPVLFAASAADGGPVKTIYAGFQYGSLSMRSFEWE